MKPWLSPRQWARAWDLMWNPGEDREETMAHIFGALMRQVIDSVREMAAPSCVVSGRHYVDPKDLWEKLNRFSLDTGKPNKEPLGMKLERVQQPLYDTIPPKMSVKFFQAPPKAKRMAGYLRSRIGKRGKP